MKEATAPHVGSAAPSRRERLRAELEDQALAQARRLLAEHGPDGLSLSAVARHVWVTTAALYRYSIIELRRMSCRYCLDFCSNLSANTLSRA